MLAVTFLSSVWAAPRPTGSQALLQPTIDGFNTTLLEAAFAGVNPGHGYHAAIYHTEDEGSHAILDALACASCTDVLLKEWYDSRNYFGSTPSRLAKALSAFYGYNDGASAFKEFRKYAKRSHLATDPLGQNFEDVLGNLSLSGKSRITLLRTDNGHSSDAESAKLFMPIFKRYAVKPLIVIRQSLFDWAVSVHDSQNHVGSNHPQFDGNKVPMHHVSIKKWDKALNTVMYKWQDRIELFKTFKKHGLKPAFLYSPIDNGGMFKSDELKKLLWSATNRECSLSKPVHSVEKAHQGNTIKNKEEIEKYYWKRLNDPDDDLQQWEELMRGAGVKLGADEEWGMDKASFVG